MVTTQQWTRVGSLAELKQTNCMTVSAEGQTIVLFAYGENVYAVDNRCPHMGFPLNQGTVKEGILTCHWHHARFDLASGGTFDLWADDVPAFPVEVNGDDLLVNFHVQRDVVAQHQQRVRDGLERNLTLVLAKSVIGLQRAGQSMLEPFRIGLAFGTRYRGDGWGRGLTTQGCMMNLTEFIAEEDKPRALYHGLSDVASDVDGMSPHFSVGSLPEENVDVPTLKRWFREFVEVRDSNAAERAIIAAVRSGADDRQMADMLFAAATDHRYLDLGHTLDFINKAFESLDIVGWDKAETVLPSLAPILVDATRMEERSAWRAPIDLAQILRTSFEALPAVLEAGANKTAKVDFDALVPVILDDKPQATVDALLQALCDGVAVDDLAGVVAYAAAVRIAQFHTSNEFGDWDTALHSFTFANAVQMGLRRVPSPDLVRGIFDGAMSIYLDRFLNIPAAKIPQPAEALDDPAALLDELETLLNQQQQVNQAGRLVADYLYNDGDAKVLMAKMGSLLLREDRNFHTVQCVEAAFQQYRLLEGTAYAPHVLIAAVRYLAAHTPTMRAQGQTYQIAVRLARGENIFEG